MKELAGKPFALLGVNLYASETKALRAFMEKENLPWRSFSGKGATGGKWHVSGTPAFFLIDRQGLIRNRWVGAPGPRALEGAIEKLLREVGN